MYTSLYTSPPSFRYRSLTINPLHYPKGLHLAALPSHLVFQKLGLERSRLSADLLATLLLPLLED